MSGRWLRVWSRGLRSEPGRSLGVAALVLVTVLIAASVPRLLGQASDNALHEEIDAAAAPSRDLELVQYGRIAAGEADPLQAVQAAGNALEARYPVPIPSVIVGQGLVVTTPLFRPSSGTAIDAVISLQIQADVDAHLRLVAGRLPTGATKVIDDPTPGADKDSKLTVFEVATSTDTAARLGVTVGGRLIMGPEKSDPLAANRGIRLAVDLVGTYEVIDPTDPYWVNDPSVAHSYTYALQQFVEYVGGTFLLDPAAYPALVDTTQSSALPLGYRWRSYISSAAIGSNQIDALSDALREAESIYPPSTPTLNGAGGFSGPQHMSPAALATNLLQLLALHSARWQSGATILTILWTGAGLVILASLALVAEVVARRRRMALAIVSRRGASAGQLASAVLGEALVLVLPAAIAGTIAAIVLEPGAELLPTLVGAGLVAIGAVILIAVASRRNRGDGSTDRARRTSRTGSGRLVAEALIVGLAILGAILLRGRGASGTSGPAGQPVPAGADPFLAVVPALVGLAAGLLAVRLLPLVLGLLARFLARRRGLVGVLGLRRAARDGSVAAVLVVALTATTVGTFASGLIDEIGAGASSASWQSIGADFKVSGSPANLAAFVARRLPGVEATAVEGSLNVTLSSGGGRILLGVDPAAIDAVAGGTPADPAFPAAMLGPLHGPIPAIVSSSTVGPGGTNAISVGQVFSILIGALPVQLQAVAVRDGYPSLPADTPFVVVSSVQLAALAADDVPPATAVLVRAPSLSVAGLQASVTDLLGTTISGQSASEAGLRQAPAVAAVSIGILTGAIAVFAYGLLTITLAIALDTASRRRETARLQILGLSTRQAFSLVLVEFAPAVLVGVLAGLGLGVILIAFVGPGLGLPTVLGVASLAPTSPDLGRLALIGLAMLALILAATLLSSMLERQTQLAPAVRD